MKTAILIFCILLKMNSLNAQCKTKVDDMTKTKITESKHGSVGHGKQCGLCTKLFLEMSVRKVDDSYYFFFEAEGSDVWSIDKNDKVLLKTSNDSVLVIYYEGAYKTSSSRSGKSFVQGTNTTIWPLYFSLGLNEEQLKYFRISPLVKIRIGTHDYEINKADFIISQIECILNSK